MKIIRYKRLLTFSLCLIYLCFGFCNPKILAQKDSIHLQEISVRPNGEPFSHYIIRQVLKNRKINNPFKSEAFTYSMYQKTWITSDIITDSLILTLSQTPDSLLSKKEIEKVYLFHFLQSHHLFLNETVCQYKFKAPKRKNTTVIASKSSGFNNPILSVLLADKESFSIYEDDFFEILHIKFINPISKGTFSRYIFWINDTIVNGNDTIYDIGFQPKKGVFNALKGNLKISKEKYAVIALTATATQNATFSLTINQNYQKAENGFYFPVYSNTLIKTNPQSKLLPIPVSCYMESSIRELNLTPQLSIWDFSTYEIDENIQKSKKNLEILTQYRTDSLSSQENKTYKLLDSLGKSIKPDRLFHFIQYFYQPEIPIGPININPLKIINFNNYRGWSFGLDLSTNQKMLKWMSIGGFFSYGLKDSLWKYGGNITFKILKKYEIEINLSYKKDLYKSGQIHFFNQKFTLLGGDAYCYILPDKFDYGQIVSAKIEGYPIKNMRFLIGFSYRQAQTCFQYNYTPNIANTSLDIFKYRTAELILGIRFAFAESKLRSDEFLLYKKSKYPVITLQYLHGFKNVFGSDFNYNKIELKISHFIKHRYGGKTEWCLKAGYIDRSVPYSINYIPEGTYYYIEFYKKNIFPTMKVNEFLADQFIYFFFRHSFGKMIYNRFFSPEVVLCQNIGFSTLRNPEYHQYIEFKTMGKGYFESGLEIENMLKLPFVGIGIGVFYRYGKYSCLKQIDNFAFQINAKFNF